MASRGSQGAYQTHKQSRLGEGENACHRRKPEHVHHVWALDFLMDSTMSGRRLKFLSIIDEYSRYCLSIKVERCMTSRDVIAELERLITLYGPPGFIRWDNLNFLPKQCKPFLLLPR